MCMLQHNSDIVEGRFVMQDHSAQSRQPANEATADQLPGENSVILPFMAWHVAET